MALLGAVTVVSAQGVGDALRYSKNNYYGTARTISMGNAFTALGGDIGSVNINPAGSAVNKFSTFTITPGLSLSTTYAQYNPYPAGNDPFGNENISTMNRINLPNIGAIINIKTGNTVGLKNVAIGFVANSTGYYLNDMAASGVNMSRTSYASALASAATGINFADLDAADFSSGYAWDVLTAWKSGIIATVGSETDYIGSTEKKYDDKTIGIAGPLTQRYGRHSKGSKYDYVINAGFNISDIVYIGANLGVIGAAYETNTYFKEIANDPSQFELDYGDGNITNFSDLRYRQRLSADVSGVYGKFGVIVLPVKGLRIGAAIQTPSSLSITEHWQTAAEHNTTDSRFSGSSTTPEGKYEYRLVTPFRYNLGVAFTIGRFAAISADFERVDYSSMKFKEKGTNDHSGFDAANEDIRDFTGSSSIFRIGGEIKPLPQLAVRAGYTLTTSPERYFDEGGRKKTPDANEQSIAFGIGYASKGSFFFGFACRRNIYPKEYIYPYADYIGDNSSPEIINKYRLWDIVATFGWRF